MNHIGAAYALGLLTRLWRLAQLETGPSSQLGQAPLVNNSTHSSLNVCFWRQAVTLH
jgi:hypothetical protein